MTQKIVFCLTPLLKRFFLLPLIFHTLGHEDRRVQIVEVPVSNRTIDSLSRTSTTTDENKRFYCELVGDRRMTESPLLFVRHLYLLNRSTLNICEPVNLYYRLQILSRLIVNGYRLISSRYNRFHNRVRTTDLATLVSYTGRRSASPRPVTRGLVSLELLGPFLCCYLSFVDRLNTYCWFSGGLQSATLVLTPMVGSCPPRVTLNHHPRPHTGTTTNTLWTWESVPTTPSTSPCRYLDDSRPLEPKGEQKSKNCYMMEKLRTHTTLQ